MRLSRRASVGVSITFEGLMCSPQQHRLHCAVVAVVVVAGDLRRIAVAWSARGEAGGAAVDVALALVCRQAANARPDVTHTDNFTFGIGPSAERVRRR